MTSLKRGFTLIELIVVITIIALIAGVVIGALNTTRTSAKATKMASELKQIERSWKIWRLDSLDGDWKNENVYGTVYGSSPDDCSDEVPLDQTDLLINVDSESTWDGPYYPDSINDPFGRPYAYDFDDDSFPTETFGGVNIFIPWCEASLRSGYVDMAERLDGIFDDDDGASSGQVRWTDADQGELVYLIDSN